RVGAEPSPPGRMSLTSSGAPTGEGHCAEAPPAPLPPAPVSPPCPPPPEPGPVARVPPAPVPVAELPPPHAGVSARTRKGRRRVRLLIGRFCHERASPSMAAYQASAGIRGAGRGSPRTTIARPCNARVIIHVTPATAQPS